MQGYSSQLKLDDCNINAIYMAANRKNWLTAEIIEHVAYYLSKTVAIAIYLFNPKKIVIASEITEVDKVLMRAI